MIEGLLTLAERIVVEIDLSAKFLNEDVLLEVLGEDTVVSQQLTSAQMLLKLKSCLEDLF